MGGVELSLGRVKDNLGSHIECYDVRPHVAYIVSCHCGFSSLFSISMNVSSRVWPDLSFIKTKCPSINVSSVRQGLLQSEVCRKLQFCTQLVMSLHYSVYLIYLHFYLFIYGKHVSAYQYL